MVKTERTSTSFTRWTLVACLAFVLAAPGWAAAQSRFSGIVVFGTSLSDPGNAFVLVGDASTPPDFMLNPFLDSQCAIREGRPSFQQRRDVGRAVWRGPWPGRQRPGGPGDELDPEATNFAVGAARAYDDGVNFNLTRQVDTFLERSGGVASSAGALCHRDGQQ